MYESLFRFESQSIPVFSAGKYIYVPTPTRSCLKYMSRTMRFPKFQLLKFTEKTRLRSPKGSFAAAMSPATSTAHPEPWQVLSQGQFHPSPNGLATIRPKLLGSSSQCGYHDVSPRHDDYGKNTCSCEILKQVDEGNPIDDPIIYRYLQLFSFM